MMQKALKGVVADYSFHLEPVQSVPFDLTNTEYTVFSPPARLDHKRIVFHKNKNCNQLIFPLLSVTEIVILIKLILPIYILTVSFLRLLEPFVL